MPETTNEIGATFEAMERTAAEHVEAAARKHEGGAKRLCPVDTDRLRASITSRSDGRLVWIVSTDVEYGPAVERGTVNQPAQPYMRPAFEEVYSGLRGVFGRLL